MQNDSSQKRKKSFLMMGSKLPMTFYGPTQKGRLPISENRLVVYVIIVWVMQQRLVYQMRQAPVSPSPLQFVHSFPILQFAFPAP